MNTEIQSTRFGQKTRVKKCKHNVLYSQVFQKAFSGDTVGPLGVTDDAFLAVGKPFCEGGEEYQIRYGQYRAHHPNADGYH